MLNKKVSTPVRRWTQATSLKLSGTVLCTPCGATIPYAFTVFIDKVLMSDQYLEVFLKAPEALSLHR